jgi:hypothetical protein
MVICSFFFWKELLEEKFGFIDWGFEKICLVKDLF